MTIATVIEKYETRVREIDTELASERKRTQPNRSLIQWDETERNTCMDMLKYLAGQI